MRIGGFQRVTLLDYPGKVACTVFTVGCNMRCPFCHNASLVTHTSDCEEYSVQDVISYLEKRQGILDGICITGGEPLLHADTRKLIQGARSLGYSVKLDTNGSFPEKLRELIGEGLLDYVAMDIKNCEEKYPLTIGVDTVSIDDIKESIKIIKESGIDYEFRTTVVRELHTLNDIKGVCKLIQGAKKYCLQQFSDSGDLIKGGFSPVLTQDLVQMKQFSEEFVQNVEIRGVNTTS